MADPVSNAPTEPGEPGRGVAAALRPGMVVGDTYEVTRLIGQGGMGAVWEAKHLRLPGKRVVVKVLLYGGTEDVVLARFRREAEIGSRLGHPNIVQVLDFNTLPGGAPYIVLELLHGETLAARLRRGRLGLDQVMSVVTQVGSGLGAAHREGIVHRDLKPDNIFLCPTDIGGELRDVAKILDFGISKIRDARTVLTQDSALVGTPQYMAPEQATGANNEIDQRTDIFALGAITFEMLAGRPPFWGDSLASVVHAVVYAPSPPLLQYAPHAPPSVAAAVARALEKSRDARFPDIAAFVRAVTGTGVTPTAMAQTMAASGVTAGTRPPASGGTMILDGGAGAGASAGAGNQGVGGGVAPSRRITAPERPQSAIPTDQVVPRKRSAGKWIVAAVVLAGALGGGAYWKLRPEPHETSRPARRAPTTTKTVAPEVTIPTVLAEAERPSPPPPPAAAAAAPPPPAEPVAARSRPAGRTGGGKEKDKALDPAAAADLNQAEAALAAGKPDDALRLAQHSLYAQASSRAYAVMARARCAKGDLGNAKAALAHVARGERGGVVRECRKAGIDLR